MESLLVVEVGDDVDIVPQPEQDEVDEEVMQVILVLDDDVWLDSETAEGLLIMVDEHEDEVDIVVLDVQVLTLEIIDEDDDVDIMPAHSYDMIVGWLHEEADDDIERQSDHEFVDEENEDELNVEADSLLPLVEVDEDEVEV